MADQWTREEFLRNYTRRANMTVEELAEHNLEPRPCNCGRESCHGWWMVDLDLAHPLPG